jgi:hypothetical protein
VPRTTGADAAATPPFDTEQGKPLDVLTRRFSVRPLLEWLPGDFRQFGKVFVSGSEIVLELSRSQSDFGLMTGLSEWSAIRTQVSRRALEVGSILRVARNPTGGLRSTASGRSPEHSSQADDEVRYKMRSIQNSRRDILDQLGGVLQALGGKLQ